MKTLVSAMVVVMVAFMAAAVQGGDDVQTLKAYYEEAISREIAECLKMSALRSSRSQHLRMKGHREASKALFLQTHRDQLVNTMVALQLKPSDYKVQRFLNDRFSCTCYAQWALRENP